MHAVAPKERANGDNVRILGVAGSLRSNSFNRRLLHAAIELLPAGTTLDVWDGLKTMPPFDEDDEGAPGAAVLRLRDAIMRANALLIATPQYNGSIPGQLKNALDWASRPYATNVLRGKPVAVIAATFELDGVRLLDQVLRLAVEVNPKTR